jgi:hypothetical protein
VHGNQPHSVPPKSASGLMSSNAHAATQRNRAWLR